MTRRPKPDNHNHSIHILHGTDDKWHLFDPKKREALDWPPLDTLTEAEAERQEFYRELGQLAADEASELAFLP